MCAGDSTETLGHPCDVVVDKLVNGDTEQVRKNLTSFFQAYHQVRKLPVVHPVDSLAPGCPKLI
jgi:hypothetical protein